MLDAVAFEDVWEKVGGSNLQKRALLSFVRFLERQSGARFVYDAARMPFRRPELVDLLLIAERLKKEGVIQEYSPSAAFCDEPLMHQWKATCLRHLKDTEHIVASGNSFASERDALTAALAEAVERHVWSVRMDHLTLRSGTPRDMARRGHIVAPERFAGFTEEQRQDMPRLALAPEKEYRWARGYSWTSERPAWVPAQTVSGNPDARGAGEPLLRSINTTGVAVYPTREGALLRAAFEALERDAYMIMWLNQLSLPRFDLSELASRHAALGRMVAQCEEYRLRPTAVRLLTDAPAYAVCVVLEDLYDSLPKVTLGLKVGAHPAAAVERALGEALRMRQIARNMRSHEKSWDPETRASQVGHLNRLLYWMEGDRAEKLRFLTEGPVQTMPREPWEDDTEGEHFARIVAWCRGNDYECASVSLARSKGNPTPWHIEAIVIPELQPMHLHESAPQVGGARLRAVPELFGYAPRKLPYLDDPHPFA